MEMEKITPTISSNLEVFVNKFPTCDDVLRVFHPSNWGLFLREQSKCLNAPNVTLATLSDYYDYSTTSALVENQYKGLYNMTSMKDYPEKGVSQAANLFAAQYEHQLTPYSLVLYFAKYTEYKDSFREFDLQDIQKECGKKFLPWWSQMKAQLSDQQAQAEQHTKGVTLEEAIVRWMMKGDSDQQIRRGGLYGLPNILGARVAGITDDMIKRARAECERREAGEVF